MAADTLRIGIIGAGRMGQIRALSARAHSACRVTWVVDTIQTRAEALAAQVGASPTTSWDRVVTAPDVDAVVVATTHKHLAPITMAAVQAGKHVFCEKPMARTFAEANAVLAAVENQSRATGGDSRMRPPTVVVGYTLRHHPAVLRAWNLVAAGAIGTPFYIRARYGHGGRPGYDREWRADPELAGGGELLDQGVHLIDLSHCFFGEFREVTGFVENFVWGGPCGEVEDNAFLLLRSAQKKVASLHASWTQWKNCFSFEIFGRDGYLAIEGLGGSYGQERLTIGHRQVESGPPQVQEIGFSSSESGQANGAWAHEWESFVTTIRAESAAPSPCVLPPATTRDALEILRIVQVLYETSRDGSKAAAAIRA